MYYMGTSTDLGPTHRVLTCEELLVEDDRGDPAEACCQAGCACVRSGTAGASRITNVVVPDS